MYDLTNLLLSVAVGAFLFSTLVIAFFGSRMAKIADRLADATGLGEAMMGALFLGGCTSLPGITTSVAAAYQGHAELAISNAIGGIAAQTVFLAVADMAYRKINLEHAAASIANLMHGALLISLLAISLLALASPHAGVFQIHPVSVLLIIAYIFGLRLISSARTEPMWKPHRTKETRVDEIKKTKLNASELALLWLRFTLLAAIVGFAGFVVTQAGIAIAGQTGFSETLVGGIFTAIATSLPELVTSIAAVRQGALTLAVGGIIGGNCFDALFLAFSDFAYRDGSIYAAAGEESLFMIALTLLLTGILLLGLLRREKHGIGNIGFESFLILLIYVASSVFLFYRG